MRRILAALVLGALILGGLAAAPASATTTGEGEGCTPGFWKNHTDDWWENPTTPIATTTKFSGPFQTTGTSGSLVGVTLLEALSLGGGPGVEGAESILARSAVAAWLNAAHEDILFPWRRDAEGIGGRPPLRATVKAALSSGDRDTMIALAERLDADNNAAVCPLGGPGEEEPEEPEEPNCKPGSHAWKHAVVKYWVKKIAQHKAKSGHSWSSKGWKHSRS